MSYRFALKSVPQLYFTVTNDLSYDQRMYRICGTLAKHGYAVTLVGRRLKDSVPLQTLPFRQKRLRCVFATGFLFYEEYNIRLFFFLLVKKTDLICAIDLDTILPCYLVSRIKSVHRVYDAHELFCEMKEVVTRPFIYKCWKKIERLTVPRFQHGYTVNEPIANEFHKMYGVQYGVIRNLPRLAPIEIPEKSERYILYQGSVNEGRCFETLIPAMKSVNARLVICGDGNFMPQAKNLVASNDLAEKVIFKGKLPPPDLKNVTLHAWAGVTLFENTGLSNVLSLGNRFFDYMHAGLPQLCIAYPLYERFNSQYGFALMIEDSSTEKISDGLNQLLTNGELYQQLQKNALAAREQLNWDAEEKSLLAIYRNILIR